MKENKKFYKGLLAGVLAGVLGVAGAGVVLHEQFGFALTRSAEASEISTDETFTSVDQEMVDKLLLLEQYVNGAYLFDTPDPQVTKEAVYKAYLNSLGDPYTCYYTVEEYNQMQESTSGSYSGIGILVSQNPETHEITILRVFSGSPAEEAGIEAGDLLVGVEDIDISEMDLSTVVSYIKGEEGTYVDVIVRRPSTEETLTLSTERRTIEVPTVESKMLDDGIGYIELLEFDAVTPDQYKSAYEALASQGMKGLIVDVRNNPGGLVDSVLEILDYMLPEGQLLSIEYVDGTEDTYKSDSKRFVDIPLVVLVNENSASASEIFAGAIQDYDAGTIVGTQTFGKGIVQNLYPLKDGDGIKITVARYYTPSGVCIHGTGITPDVQAAAVADETVTEPESAAEDEGKETEKTAEATDLQLQKAVEVMLEKLEAK